MSSEPRRFGLTQSQMALVLSLIGLGMLAALAMWARQSDTGTIVFYAVTGTIIGGTILHRLVSGHWFDGSR
jgi:hypothetical protein